MAGWGSGSFSYLDHFAYDDFGKVKDKYEKGVDVALVTDLLLLAARDAFDVAIICAGDADFFRAVEGVKEMGKEIYMRALIAIA